MRLRFVFIASKGREATRTQNALQRNRRRRRHQRETIALPNGFQPEGFTIGRGTGFYVGSLVDGAVFRGDLVTGRGSILVKGTAGTMKTGLKVDGRNRLWAASASGGGADVYDAGSGRLLAHYQFTSDPNTFVNDLIVTRDAVYFTDSMQPVLYVVPLGRGGRLPDQSAVRTLRLSGGAGCAGSPSSHRSTS